MRVNVRRGAAGLGLTLCAALATVGIAVSPAQAGDDRRQVVGCDATGCLIADGVVDSDGDGFCDADELLAGTDPHDPTSVPPLRRLVELAGKELLPSFENGLAAFVVLPPDIAARRLPEGTPDLLSAFPMGGRKSTLEALGISGELLAVHGIDIATSGLTVGLGDTSAGEPPRRLGRFDVSLISDGGDDDLTVPKLPGWTGTTVIWRENGDLETVRHYDDGSDDREVTGSDHTTRGEHDTKDGRQTRTWVTEVSERDEGATHVTEVRTSYIDPDLKTTRTDTTVSTTNDSGVKTTVRTTTEYHYDDDGNAAGTTETSTVKVEDKDGNTLAEGSQTRECDASGQCGSPYINPDADDANVMTAEMVEHALRQLGSNVTTLPGWTAPGDEAPKDPSDLRTIILVDPESQDVAILADVPRLSSAQPESRPDLPSPLEGVDPKSPGGPR